jgi:hypothetical protein
VCLEDFPGKSAVSEPETQAVRNYFMNLFQDYNTSPTSPASLDAMGIFIDLHSFSQLVLWPWGYGATLAPNNTQLQTLGRKFAFFNNHTPEQASALYPAAGDTNDDVYAEKGIPAYTFEMGTAFFQGCTAFENTIYPKNLQALIYAAKVAWAPYRLPLGPDALTVKLSNASGPKLTATIDDTRYNNSNGTEATQNIAAAEYYIDAFPAPGWPGTPHAMTAVDGSFNAKSENVTAQVDTTGLLKNQRHLIYVRGKDANNNWGPVSAVFMTWPTVNFTFTVNKVTVAFKGIGSDPDPGDGIASWSWNFGDGTTATTQNPSHTYQKPYSRSYNVTLTVKDKAGLSSSVTKNVQINP